MPRHATRLPSDLPRERVVRALQRLGFVLVREGARHSVYRAQDGSGRQTAIPRHSRIKRQLLQGILSGLRITEGEFMAQY
jgi:predicted RNA binding protein YcfA (HicA-like mRNA interferase family)